MEFDWAEPHAYALDDLRVELRRAIESDDDVYAQLRSQSAHLSALRTATTFDALVEAVDPR